MIQYDGNLKTERYGEVRVVSLSSLIELYQGFSFEGVQKCGNRDVTESSLVSSCSKDNLSGRRATTFQIRNQNQLLIWFNNLKTRKSARQSLETGDYIVERSSRPQRAQTQCDF